MIYHALLETGSLVEVRGEKLTRDYAILINGVRMRSVYEPDEWEECARRLVEARHGKIKEWLLVGSSCGS